MYLADTHVRLLGLAVAVCNVYMYMVAYIHFATAVACKAVFGYHTYIWHLKGKDGSFEHSPRTASDSSLAWTLLVVTHLDSVLEIQLQFSEKKGVLLLETRFSYHLSPRR